VHEAFFFLYIKRVGIEILMLVATIYAIPLLIEDRESEAVQIICACVCWAFAIQGAISLVGFLIPEFGDYLISIKAPEFQAMLNDPRRNISRYRGFVLSGSLFFELPATYGLAFIMYIRLLLIQGQTHIVGHMRYIVALLMIVGIMICGRTGFVGVAVGIILYFIFVPDPVVIFNRLLKRSVIFIPILLIVYFFVLTPQQKESFEDDLFPFAFEMYYNYKETGSFSTGSTDATKGFYYPLRDETLMFGHGTDTKFTSYRPIDAGYMRTLIYGGVPFLLMLICYQFLYFKIPLSLLDERGFKWKKVDFYCFWLLFLYILVLHIKDYALGTMHLAEVIFLLYGVAFIMQYAEGEDDTNQLKQPKLEKN
jgi:hypothetical protein